MQSKLICGADFNQPLSCFRHTGTNAFGSFFHTVIVFFMQIQLFLINCFSSLSKALCVGFLSEAYSVKETMM